MDFPENPDELDLTWLAATTGIETLSSFTAEQMTGGFWSNMVRLQLSHAESTAPTSLVAKFANPSDKARFICSTFGFNQIEIGFYQSTAANAPVKTPRCYHAQADDTFSNYVLLMEDLGSTQIDQLAGCTADQAKAVVEAVATLHSHWWEHPNLSQLAWLRKPAEIAQSLTLVMSMISDQAFANLKTCPPEISEAWPQIIEVLPTLLDQLDNHPATLTHGDVRASNLFVDHNQSQVGFIDWQSVRHTHGCYDLAYFLTQSLSGGTRREHESNLIKHYQQQLARNGVDAPSMEELEFAYKLCSVYCLVYPIIAASSSHASDNPDALRIAERAFSAVLDLGALELIL